jgi:hypothetical protein
MKEDLIKKQHNNNTIQLFQKIVLFIDSSLINASSLSLEEKAGMLTKNILNIKDVLFSEVVRNSYEEEINNNLLKKEQKSVQKKEDLKEEKIQVERLEKDQSV